MTKLMRLPKFAKKKIYINFALLHHSKRHHNETTDKKNRTNRTVSRVLQQIKTKIQAPDSTIKKTILIHKT